jgi:hypothetical protein
MENGELGIFPFSLLPSKKNYCDYRNSLAKMGVALQLPQKKSLKRLPRARAISRK